MSNTTGQTEAAGRVASDSINKSITQYRIVRVSEAEFNQLVVDNSSNYRWRTVEGKKIMNAHIAEMATMGMKPDYVAEVLYMNDDIRLRWFMTDEVIH